MIRAGIYSPPGYSIAYPFPVVKRIIMISACFIAAIVAAVVFIWLSRRG